MLNKSKNKKMKNGTKVKNPLAGNAEIKSALEKMFGNNVAEQMTSRPMYKYTQGEPLPFKVVYSERRVRQS